MNEISCSQEAANKCDQVGCVNATDVIEIQAQPTEEICH